MSDKTLEFHFDFASPTTYLTYTQVPRIAQETGAALVRHPMKDGAPASTHMPSAGLAASMKKN
jgi:2-hydroxychromene-2-carboxylate isomerase